MVTSTFSLQNRLDSTTCIFQQNSATGIQDGISKFIIWERKKKKKTNLRMVPNQLEQKDFKVSNSLLSSEANSTKV